MATQDLLLRGEWIALDDLLKVTGLAASGGAAKAMVAEGHVRLDGQIETQKTKKVRAGQQVVVHDTTVRVMAAAQSR